MFMMVSKVKTELPAILTGKVLDGDESKINPVELLHESEEVREERQRKGEMCRMIRDAMRVIEDVKYKQ
jgi:hypothetical protein